MYGNSELAGSSLGLKVGGSHRLCKQADPISLQRNQAVVIVVVCVMHRFLNSFNKTKIIQLLPYLQQIFTKHD